MRLAIMDREIDGYLDNTAPNAWGNDMPSTDETIARIGAQWEHLGSNDPSAAIHLQ